MEMIYNDGGARNFAAEDAVSGKPRFFGAAVFYGIAVFCGTGGAAR
jgi:hypothetical protein